MRTRSPYRHRPKRFAFAIELVKPGGARLKLVPTDFVYEAEAASSG
jgi:hypothetical protein